MSFDLTDMMRLFLVCDGGEYLSSAKL